MSFLHVRACGGCGGPPGVGPACRVCVLRLTSGSPLVGVFVGVRLVRRGLQGNVLVIEIYVLALSEPSLQRASSEKDAQSCPETGISSLVRGRDFRLGKTQKIKHLRCLCIKATSKFRGLFRRNFSDHLKVGASILDACA